MKLELIGIDRIYQRATDPVAVRKIINNFDRDAVGSLTVGRRLDGSCWVVDGGHRLLALRFLKYSEWDCTVFPSEGVEHEARVFRRMNKDRRSVSAVTVFNAECIEGLPHSLEIRAAVEAAGFFVSRKSSWPNIQCVAELRRTHSRLGSAGVSESLGIIKEVWPNEDGGLKAPIIGGVSVVLAVTGVSVPRMVKTLKTVSPETESDGIG